MRQLYTESTGSMSTGRAWEGQRVNPYSPPPNVIKGHGTEKNLPTAPTNPEEENRFKEFINRSKNIEITNATPDAVTEGPATLSEAEKRREKFEEVIKEFFSRSEVQEILNNAKSTSQVKEEIEKFFNLPEVQEMFKSIKPKEPATSSEAEFKKSVEALFERFNESNSSIVPATVSEEEKFRKKFFNQAKPEGYKSPTDRFFERKEVQDFINEEFKRLHLR